MPRNSASILSALKNPIKTIFNTPYSVLFSIILYATEIGRATATRSSLYPVTMSVNGTRIEGEYALDFASRNTSLCQIIPSTYTGALSQLSDYTCVTIEYPVHYFFYGNNNNPLALDCFNSLAGAECSRYMPNATTKAIGLAMGLTIAGMASCALILGIGCIINKYLAQHTTNPEHNPALPPRIYTQDERRERTVIEVLDNNEESNKNEAIPAISYGEERSGKDNEPPYESSPLLSSLRRATG